MASRSHSGTGFVASANALDVDTLLSKLQQFDAAAADIVSPSRFRRWTGPQSPRKGR
jgi:hypothetical protein